jgi:phosphatidylglycerophosphate synthase
MESNKNTESNKKGRKIPSNIENPFDILLIGLCDKLIDFCYTIGITPNMVTIFRIFFVIFVVNDLFTTSDIIFPVIGALFFYFLDCLDGHLARATDQVTVLGDYLDHFADISFILVIMIFILIKKYPGKKYICIGLIILLYLMLVHMGLQQKNYKKIKEEELGHEFESFETLNLLNNLHGLSEGHICWTRFFGCGTLILFICFAIFWVQYNQKC